MPNFWEISATDTAHPAHPSRQAWDRFCLEEAPTQERTHLQQHLSACPRCQSRVQQIQAERTAFASSFPRAAFLASVPATPSVGGWMGFLRWMRWNGAWGWGLAGACGVFLLWLGSVGSLKEGGLDATRRSDIPTFLDRKESSAPYHRELWRSKGSGPSLDVFVHREGVQRSARSGERFRTGDQLGFRYRAAGYGFLTLVLVDAKGAVSWLYPSSAAPSIPIAAQGRLQDAVELDQAVGKERIIGFFAHRPLSPTQILSALQTPKEGPLELSRAQKHTTNPQRYDAFVKIFVLQK